MRDTLTVAYGTPLPRSGNCPSAASWCELITAANSRALTIGYNAANLVTSVTDPMGRQWAYAYTGSDLTSATDPMGNTTSYGYGAGTTGPLNASDLTSVTSPNAQPGGPDAGKVTTIAYNPAGQVTSQTGPMGIATTYTWTRVQPRHRQRRHHRRRPDGNTTVYYYAQSALAAQSAWTGTTLTSEQDYVPDRPSRPATTAPAPSSTPPPPTATSPPRPTTQGQPAHRHRPRWRRQPGRHDHAAVHQPGPGGLRLGRHRVQHLPGVGRPISGHPRPGDHPPSSAPPQGETWTLYDDYGNQFYDTTGVYERGNNTAAYSQTTYQLFKNNTITLNRNNITCAASPPSPSLPCATINADGVVTQLAYDAQGDLASSSTPDGNPGNELATTTYGYDGDGEQTSVTSPHGNLSGANAGNYTTVTAYNSDGQQTSVTEGGGAGHTVTPRVVSYGYDANGNQTTMQDARGTTTYNADDQATLATDPLGNATLTCYDGDANVAQTFPYAGVAANGLTAASCPTSYPAGYSQRLATDATVDTFNALGKVTTETTPLPAGQTGPPNSETTTNTCDNAGNLIEADTPSTANGGSSQITKYIYNSPMTAGFNTGAASTVSYCYDPNGVRTSVVYADGNAGGTAQCQSSYPWTVTASPQAGPLGLSATISYSNSAAAHSVTYSYDANGNRTGMTDATGSATYVWDAFDELTSSTNGAGKTVTYAYDGDGNTTGITYPLGSPSWAATQTVSYSYDKADSLTSVTDFNGNQITVTPRADGQSFSEALGATGDTIYYTYDTTDGISQIALKNSSSTLQSFAYSEAPAGNILSETDSPAGPQSPASYTYDAQGRVASMTPGTGPIQNYSFDVVRKPDHAASRRRRNLRQLRRPDIDGPGRDDD